MFVAVLKRGSHRPPFAGRCRKCTHPHSVRRGYCPSRSLTALHFSVFAPGFKLVSSHQSIWYRVFDRFGQTLKTIVLDELGQLKRQLDALTRVEPGVTVGVVTIAQAVVSDLLRATDTLRDILSGHLDMDTARGGPRRSLGPHAGWRRSAGF